MRRLCIGVWVCIGVCGGPSALPVRLGSNSVYTQPPGCVQGAADDESLMNRCAVPQVDCTAYTNGCDASCAWRQVEQLIADYPPPPGLGLAPTTPFRPWGSKL